MLITIKTDELDTSEGNIRKYVSHDDISASLERGEPVREPLFVYLNEEKRKYLIWDGRRRFEAGKEYLLEEFPCIVFQNITNEDEARRASIKHNRETKAVPYPEIASGIVADLEALKQTMSMEDARDQIMKEYSLHKSQLSKLESVGSLNPGLAREVSRMKLSQTALYRLSNRPQDEQVELAKVDWERHGYEDAGQYLMHTVDVLKNNEEELKVYFAPQRVQVATNAMLDTFSQKTIDRRTHGSIKNQSQKTQLTQKASSQLKAVKKVKETKKLTITLVDYHWTALEAMAQKANRRLEKFLENHLKTQAVRFLKAKSKALAGTVKIQRKKAK